MNRKHDAKIAAGYRLRDRLKEVGLRDQSEVVTALCRMASGLRETASRLHLDNMQLRELVEEYKSEARTDEKGSKT